MNALNIFGLVLGLAFIALGVFAARFEVAPGPKWIRRYESSYMPAAKWFGAALLVLAGIAFVYASLRTIFAAR
jgi:hypothetical protein